MPKIFLGLVKSMGFMYLNIGYEIVEIKSVIFFIKRAKNLKKLNKKCKI